MSCPVDFCSCFGFLRLKQFLCNVENLTWVSFVACGHVIPLQYSDLQSSMDCVLAMGSQRVGLRLSDFHFTWKQGSNWLLVSANPCTLKELNSTPRVALLVKNLPVMLENWVQFLDWKDPLEKGKGYPLPYSDLENSIDCIAHGVTESNTTKWVFKKWFKSKLSLL